MCAGLILALSIAELLKVPNLSVGYLAFALTSGWSICRSETSAADGRHVAWRRTIQMVKLFQVHSALDEIDLAPLLTEFTYLVQAHDGQRDG